MYPLRVLSDSFLLRSPPEPCLVHECPTVGLPRSQGLPGVGSPSWMEDVVDLEQGLRDVEEEIHDLKQKKMRFVVDPYIHDLTGSRSSVSMGPGITGRRAQERRSPGILRRG